MAAGILCGIASAVFYTCSNIALRQSVGVDPFLVSAMKAVPTVLFLAPFVVFMRFSGRTIATSLKMVPRFAAVSLVGQVFGNGAFQLALGSIGLAATVPIVLGVLIIGGAILGRVLLNEPVRPRTIIAMIALIVAVLVLSQPGSTKPPDQSLTPWPVWIGVMCAAASGFAYSLFGVVMRQTLNGGVSAPATMLISGIVGSFALWTITFSRLEPASLAEYSSNQWGFMAAGGLFNFAAFIALSMSLKTLPVVSVNLINASQVAMAAIAGVMLFAEPITPPLVSGIALTFFGLLILTGGRSAKSD